MNLMCLLVLFSESWMIGNHFENTNVVQYVDLHKHKQVVRAPIDEIPIPIPLIRRCKQIQVTNLFFVVVN
jgi:hypothetical protein